MSDTTDTLSWAPPELRPMMGHAAHRLADELHGVFGPGTIERFMGDSYQAFIGAKVTSYVPLLVERFTRQRLRALARTQGGTRTGTPMVVFLCVHNAGRSQMAAGWLQHLAGDHAEVFSGGSDPAGEVNRAAVAAMAEVGIDISDSFPKPWTDEVVRAADVIVTMGCGDACPVFPGKRYEDWDVADPAGKGLDAVRPIRDEIGRRVRALMDELGIAVAR